MKGLHGRDLWKERLAIHKFWRWEGVFWLHAEPRHAPPTVKINPEKDARARLSSAYVVGTGRYITRAPLWGPPEL